MNYSNLIVDSSIKDNDINSELLNLVNSVVRNLNGNLFAKIQKSTDSTTVSLIGFYSNKGGTSEYKLTDDEESRLESGFNKNKLVFSETNHKGEGNPSYTIRYNPSTTTSTTKNPVPSDLQSALQQGSTTSGREALKGYLKGQVLQGNVNLQGVNEEIERFKQLIK